MTKANSMQTSEVKLKVREKVAYGASNAAFAIIMFFTSSFLLFFYSDALGLSPALAGLAIMLGKIWDAVNDPLTGYISDNAETRWGRRRVFLLIGAIPLGILFYFMWAPFGFLLENPGAGLFLYMLIAWILLMSGLSILDIPYLALGAEMTSETDERSSVFAYSNAAYRLGQLLAVLAGNFVLMSPDSAIGFLHGTLGLMTDSTAQNAIDFLSNVPEAFRWVGAFFGLLITALILWTFTGTKERVKREEIEELEGNSFKEILINQWKTLENKPFRVLIIATLVADINTGIVLATFPYALTYWLLLDDYFAMLFGIVIIMQIFFGFAWVWVSKKKGKKFVFLAAQLIYGLTFTAMYFMEPGNVSMMAVAMIFVSMALAAYLIVWSLIADIVDYDEYKTHRRREGTFYSLYTLTNKIATAIGIFFVGLFLSAVGMEGDFTSTPTMIFWLKMFFGPFVGLLNIVGYIIFLRFPYNKEEHKKIQDELELRKVDMPAK